MLMCVHESGGICVLHEKSVNRFVGGRGEATSIIYIIYNGLHMTMTMEQCLSANIL